MSQDLVALPTTKRVVRRYRLKFLYQFESVARTRRQMTAGAHSQRDLLLKLTNPLLGFHFAGQCQLLLSS